MEIKREAPLTLNASALGKSTGTVECVVSHERVRPFCESLDDLNPLLLDPQVASQASTGRLIAPPTFINTFREGKTKLLLGELGVDVFQGDFERGPAAAGAFLGGDAFLGKSLG